jgi:hypothetical protein
LAFKANANLLRPHLNKANKNTIDNNEESNERMKMEKEKEKEKKCVINLPASFNQA